MEYTEQCKIRNWGDLIGKTICKVTFGETITFFFNDSWAEFAVLDGGRLIYDDTLRPSEPEEVADWDFAENLKGMVIRSVSVPDDTHGVEDEFVTLTYDHPFLAWIGHFEKPQRRVILK